MKRNMRTMAQNKDMKLLIVVISRILNFEKTVTTRNTRKALVRRRSRRSRMDDSFPPLPPEASETNKGSKYKSMLHMRTIKKSNVLLGSILLFMGLTKKSLRIWPMRTTRSKMKTTFTTCSKTAKYSLAAGLIVASPEINNCSRSRPLTSTSKNRFRALITTRKLVASSEYQSIKSRGDPANDVFSAVLTMARTDLAPDTGGNPMAASSASGRLTSSSAASTFFGDRASMMRRTSGTCPWSWPLGGELSPRPRESSGL
mmetsp:Transcript_33778/g.97049  ORF Transcript_33778/g.97049 Transcript_33778/m.97049 type:complete len:258 (+) Transcript_33778:778-1551(+)